MKYNHVERLYFVILHHYIKHQEYVEYILFGVNYSTSTIILYNLLQVD